MDKVLIREGRMEYEMERGQKRRGYMMPTYHWLRHTFTTNCCRLKRSSTSKPFNVVGAIST